MELVLSELSVAERYKFLTALVIPRPVAFATTRDEHGVHNAAPFSFFNVFSEDPALVVLGFSSRPDGRKKDTLTNIRKHGEFVVNMVDRRVIEAMHICSADVPYGESEIDYAGITLAPSRVVDVQRIKEAPVNLECRVKQILDVNERRTLVLGEVLCIHILDEIVDPATKRVIPERYSPIARLYGDHYAWLGERYTRAIPDYEEIKARRAVNREAAE
ncbi:MAG TPA: flavin reductase family protein [Xanthobacteraceae bacterium]|nr:flavin reductase family protein [Xanthobacteraceae bacterium]